jgi:hypothetical protein
VPAIPEELDCAGCGRSGEAADVAAWWSLSWPPRPVGSTARTPGQPGLTAHCPDCARRHVRDVEARLDP